VLLKGHGPAPVVEVCITAQLKGAYPPDTTPEMLRLYLRSKVGLD
jgi:hypothetical protein